MEQKNIHGHIRLNIKYSITFTQYRSTTKKSGRPVYLYATEKENEESFPGARSLPVLYTTNGIWHNRYRKTVLRQVFSFCWSGLKYPMCTVVCCVLLGKKMIFFYSNVTLFLFSLVILVSIVFVSAHSTSTTARLWKSHIT